MVDNFVFDGGMKNMARRGSEVTAMEVSKCSGGPNVRGFERTVPGIDSLAPLKEEETRSWTVIGFD